MATDIIRQDRVVMSPKRAAQTTPLADAVEVATWAWTRALEACANVMGLEDSKAAVDQLRQGNGTARMHCCRGLAEQMAASLRTSYQNIQAVYAPDCDTCPQSYCHDQAVLIAPLVHLFIWAHHKTPAIGLRTAALGNALAGACQEVIGVQERPSLLQARVIDDADLENLFGAGRRERWSIQLQAHLLNMDEPIEEV